MGARGAIYRHYGPRPSDGRMCERCAKRPCEPDRRICASCRHAAEPPRPGPTVRPRRRDFERDREPYKGKHCHACEGMPWHRPMDEPCKCGGAYGEDPDLLAMRPRAWEAA